MKNNITTGWDDEIESLRELILSLSAKFDAKESEDEGENDIFPWNKWRIMRELGVTGIPLQEKYGGLGKDILDTMYLLEALGFACADSGINFSLSSHIVSTGIPIQKYGNRNQKNKYLSLLCSGENIGAHAITEPGSGSDAFSMRTTATKRGDKFLLNGSKVFITNGTIADTFVIYAATDIEQPTFKRITAFLVDSNTAGFAKGKPIKKMGLDSAPFCELFFRDCAVPEENVLGGVGNGYRVFNYVMKWEILCSFAMNIGEMQRQLEKCIEYSSTRKQFGLKISKYQAISHKIAAMKIRLEAARALLYQAGSIFKNNRKDLQLNIAMAKVAVSEAYVHSSLDAIQIFGAYGYCKEYMIEHYLRDSIGSTIYSGSTEIQKNIIANILGL